MNWISNFKKIKIKVKKIFKKQPAGQQESDWKSCPQCKKISYLPDLIANSYICDCSFHFDIPPKLRLDNLFDSDYEIIESPGNINPDPLNFEVKDAAREGYKYIDKIKKYRKTTGQQTALMCASGNISNLSAVVVCFNPKFGGGRFGPAENEHFSKAANFAIQKKVDMWIVIYQSSGIDVHSGITGLSSMVKSIIAMKEINTLPLNINDRLINSSNGDNFKFYWMQLKKWSKVNKTFHSIRHTFASRSAMKGWSIVEIAQQGGRKELRVLKRYTHLKAEYLAKKLE